MKLQFELGFIKLHALFSPLALYAEELKVQISGDISRKLRQVLQLAQLFQLHIHPNRRLFHTGCQAQLDDVIAHLR